ncbi:MAG: hypothetical protein ACLSVG_02520 [Clostridia bacterium]
MKTSVKICISILFIWFMALVLSSCSSRMSEYDPVSSASEPSGRPSEEVHGNRFFGDLLGDNSYALEQYQDINHYYLIADGNNLEFDIEKQKTYLIDFEYNGWQIHLPSAIVNPLTKNIYVFAYPIEIPREDRFLSALARIDLQTYQVEILKQFHTRNMDSAGQLEIIKGSMYYKQASNYYRITGQGEEDVLVCSADQYSYRYLSVNGKMGVVDFSTGQLIEYENCVFPVIPEGTPGSVVFGDSYYLKLTFSEDRSVFYLRYGDYETGEVRLVCESAYQETGRFDLQQHIFWFLDPDYRPVGVNYMTGEKTVFESLPIRKKENLIWAGQIGTLKDYMVFPCSYVYETKTIPVDFEGTTMENVYRSMYNFLFIYRRDGTFYKTVYYARNTGLYSGMSTGEDPNQAYELFTDWSFIPEGEL